LSKNVKILIGSHVQTLKRCLRIVLTLVNYHKIWMSVFIYLSNSSKKKTHTGILELNKTCILSSNVTSFMTVSLFTWLIFFRAPEICQTICHGHFMGDRWPRTEDRDNE
jgi:hypothetical protein